MCEILNEKNVRLKNKNKIINYFIITRIYNINLMHKIKHALPRFTKQFDILIGA